MKKMSKSNVAAIDLGTNSCRLLIADEKGQTLYSDAVSTRLGEGMYAQMQFTQEAIQRGIECLQKYKVQMNKLNVEKYRAIATAACRMATNGEEFIKLVKNNVGIDLEVIDGEEEARLNLKGAMQNVLGKSKYVVVYDLGGGSTEITLATNEVNPQIIYTISIPWGARNASEAFGLCNYVERGAEALKCEIAKYVDSFVENSQFSKYNDVCLVATSSTPLRLACFVKKHGEYNREKADGCELQVKDVNVIIDEIMQMSQSEMAQCPYIGEKRSFIFMAACVIFRTIYEKLHFEKITASLKSAKDGIVEELVK